MLFGGSDGQFEIYIYLLTLNTVVLLTIGQIVNFSQVMVLFSMWKVILGYSDFMVFCRIPVKSNAWSIGWDISVESQCCRYRAFVVLLNYVARIRLDVWRRGYLCLFCCC